MKKLFSVFAAEHIKALGKDAVGGVVGHIELPCGGGSEVQDAVVASEQRELYDDSETAAFGVLE